MLARSCSMAPWGADVACTHANLAYLGLRRRSGLCRSSGRAAQECAVMERPDSPPAAAQAVAPAVDMSILQLEELSAGRIGQVRCRQHANPLKREFAVPASAPDWEAVYTTPTNDLAVDIGSGYGRFNLMMAKLNAAPYNYLGLEIRRPIVQRANLYAQLLGFQGRVHYTVANGTISLPSMLSGYPGKIGLVTVQYPDPHFKKRHQKRRIVQRELVHALAQLLGSGARVLLQSDVQEVSEHMRDEFEAHGAEYFQPSLQHHRPGGVFTCAATPSATATAGEPEAEAGAEAGSAAAGGVELGAAAELEASGSRFRSHWQRHGWLIENPLGVPTERELLSLGQGGNVYRMLLLRTDVPWRKPSV